MDSAGSCDLMVTDVDAEDASGGTYLLSKMKCRKAFTAGNIENAEARQKIQMLEQGLGKWSGPIVVLR